MTIPITTSKAITAEHISLTYGTSAPNCPATSAIALAADIHKLSMVPDLTDEQFAGNVSGVAMRFKLLGLEQLTKIKERWFREGLRTRLRRFCAFLALRGEAEVDAGRVEIIFSRSLPVNELETAQTLSAYRGLVPDRLLLSQVPFIGDAQAVLADESADGR